MRQESVTRLVPAGDSPPGEDHPGVDHSMPKTERDRSGATIEEKRREALSAGAVMVISAGIPIVVGTVTMIYDLTTVPFGLSCVVSVCLFCSARDRLHESRVAEHIQCSEKRVIAYIDKRDRAWRDRAGKLRSELLDASRAGAISDVARSIEEMEQQRTRLRGI